MKNTQEIALRLTEVRSRITRACARANRNPSEVRLLLATKTVDIPRIKAVLELGETLIGENKVQELKEKGPSLVNTVKEAHFIGHLQSNKIKDVLKWVSCIQSIDRLSLAQKLQRRLEYENRSIEVLIQVNTSYETSKFGVAPEKAIELIKEVAVLKNIKIKGLMTIGLFSADEEKVRKCFKVLKNVQQEVRHLQIPNVTMDELSMGMSGDLEIAIEEGATIVRVGTSIFGERAYPDSYYWNEEKEIRS